MSNVNIVRAVENNKCGSHVRQINRIFKSVLDALPDAYGHEIWPKACEGVYLHVFDKYAGEGMSVYG